MANAAPFSTILAQGGGEPNFADGLLDITWLSGDSTFAEQLLNLTDLASNGLVNSTTNSNIKFKQAQTVIIEGDEVLNYVIDGENRQADRISIQIKPSSLKVLG